MNELDGRRSGIGGGVSLISIIDDDEIVRQALESLVKSLGYSTAVFSSVEEYLESEFLQETRCLITDLNLPGMSGRELQKRLNSNGFNIPIIFITGRFEEKTRSRAMDSGACGFLRKPFHEHSLVSCIDMALERSTGTLRTA